MLEDSLRNFNSLKTSQPFLYFNYIKNFKTLGIGAHKLQRFFEGSSVTCFKTFTHTTSIEKGDEEMSIRKRRLMSAGRTNKFPYTFNRHSIVGREAKQSL